MNDKRQLLAVVFTDIIGFQRMTATNETRTVQLVREHREIVRGCLPAHGGREMRTVGDAFLLLFESAVEAVRFGIAVQERMAALNEGRPEDEQVWMRIGVHLGEVVLGHEGELYGETVNVASRVEPHAPPGGLCVTDAVVAQARAHVPRTFERLGVIPLKGVENPPELYRLAVGRAAPALPSTRPRLWTVVVAVAAVLIGLVGAWAWYEPAARTVKVSDNPDAQRLWEEGMALWRRSDQTAATARLRAALEADPEAPRLLLSRAYAEMDPGASLELRERAIDRAPDGPDGDLLRLLERSQAAGDDPEMARAWDAWGAAHPEDEEGQFMRALAYPGHGLAGLDSHHGGPHDHGPLIQLRAFVERYPDNLQARLILAGQEFQANHRDLARAQLDEAIRRCPTCAQAQALFGQLLLEGEQWEEGERALRYAAELDPGMPGLRETLAMAAYRQGHEEERVRLVEAVLGDDLIPASQRAEFAFLHGGLLIAGMRLRDGRALQGRSLDLADATLRGQWLLQWFDQEVFLGELAVARDLLGHLAEVISDPATPGQIRDSLVVARMAAEQRLAFESGDEELVRRLDERLRALPADRFVDGSRDARLHDSEVRVALFDGRIDDAIAILSRPAPGCTRDANEARAYEFVGDTTKAALAWESAANDPNCRGSLATKAWLLTAERALEQGDRARAEELVRKVRKEWPNPDRDAPLAARLIALEQRLAG